MKSLIIAFLTCITVASTCFAEDTDTNCTSCTWHRKIGFLQSSPRGREDQLLARLFVASPYERSSTAVHRDILRRAQSLLRDKGYYTGAIDGVPGPLSIRAISLYQKAGDLIYTATLDTRTLDEMDLLPENTQTQ